MFLGAEAAAAMLVGEDYPESKSGSGGSWQIYFSLKLEWEVMWTESDLIQVM